MLIYLIWKLNWQLLKIFRFFQDFFFWINLSFFMNFLFVLMFWNLFFSLFLYNVTKCCCGCWTQNFKSHRVWFFLLNKLIIFCLFCWTIVFYCFFSWTKTFILKLAHNKFVGLFFFIFCLYGFTKLHPFFWLDVNVLDI